MRLGTVRRILKESLGGGEKPAWLDGVLEVLNEFIEKVGQALQNKLTFQDNFSCRIHSQTLTSATSVTIGTQSTLRVRGVQLLYWGGKTLSGFKWDRGTNNSITLTATFTEGGSAACEILILLG